MSVVLIEIESYLESKSKIESKSISNFVTFILDAIGV